MQTVNELLAIINRYTGVEYIYVIEVDGYVYVGQSKAQTKISGSQQVLGGNRLLYRLRAPFVYQSYDEKELGELMRENGLKNTKVTIFNAPYFGLPFDLLNDFKKAYKQSGIKDSTNEITDLNAAEILHILRYSDNPKLLNRAMGGTAGSLSVIGPDGTISHKVLTTAMSPQKAREIFFSSFESVNRIRKFVDSFNEVVFTDQWKTFYSKNGGDVSDTNASMTYDELVDSLVENFKSIAYFSSGFRDTVVKSIKEKVKNWVESKVNFFQNIVSTVRMQNPIFTQIDIKKYVNIDNNNIENLANYITSAVYNQIDKWLRKEFKNSGYSNVKISSKNKDWKKFRQEHLKDVDLSKTFKIIDFTTIANVDYLEKQMPNWGKSFMAWHPKGIELPEIVKKIVAVDVFQRISIPIMDRTFYNNQDMYIVDKYVIPYNLQGDYLSNRVRNKYQIRRITFPSKNWANYYNILMSITINSYDPWTLDEEQDIIYRPKLTLKTADDKYFIGHRRQFMPNWDENSINDIEIY